MDGCYYTGIALPLLTDTQTHNLVCQLCLCYLLRATPVLAVLFIGYILSAFLLLYHSLYIKILYLHFKLWNCCYHIVLLFPHKTWSTLILSGISINICTWCRHSSYIHFFPLIPYFYYCFAKTLFYYGSVQILFDISSFILYVINYAIIIFLSLLSQCQKAFLSHISHIWFSLYKIL